MARLKTSNTPDLAVLLAPTSPMTLAVEQAMLRGHKSTVAAMPVADRIAVRIAGAITENQIQAGQRLLESDISEALHVSRAPVREALRILERERLVEFQARHGAVVTAPDANDLRDIYVVRGALYQILLQQLMDECVDDLAATFARHMPRIAKAADERSVDDYALQSFLLNLAMIDLCPNGVLVDQLTSLSLRTLRYVRIGLAGDPSLLVSSLKSWRALERAISRRDIAAVLDTAGRRITGSRDAAVQALRTPDQAPTATGSKRAYKPQPTPRHVKPSAS